MIIVTGASRGLGRDISERLHTKGVEILGVSRKGGDLPFKSVQCDVSSISDVRKLVQYVKKTGKTVEGLINAAGISSMNLALTTPLETSKKIIEINLLGSIYCSQALGLLLVRNGSGNIINFSTIAVPLAIPGEAVYVASKAGIEGFTRTFAREMSGFNVRVNCIAPGPIATDILRGVSESQIKTIIDRQIIRREFSPSDVSDLVEILIGDKAGSLSGQILNVGGV